MSFDWDQAEDEVRPFFGEREGDRDDPPRQDVPMPAAHREYGHEGWRQHHISEGRCPRVACHADLDEGACPRCGWSLLEERMRERVEAIEDRDDYMPRLPIGVDEYAPASLDEVA